MELASAPVALFLDEPTSGLDSTASLHVANILQSLGSLGLTIVSVIHQPRIEIFETFDDVILLVPGGKVAYIGPTNECVNYFQDLGYFFNSNLNPADILMDILSGKGDNTVRYSSKDLAMIWYNKSRVIKKIQNVNDMQPMDMHSILEGIISKRGSSLFKQTILCTLRSFTQQFRTMNSFLLECFVGTIAGFLIGISTSSDVELFIGLWKMPYSFLSSAPLQWQVPLYALLIGLSVALAGAPSGCKVFSEERPVYWRESSSGHSKIAYYIGKSIASLPRFVLSSLHFAAIYAYLSRTLISFEVLYSIVILQFYGVYGLSACVSMLTSRANASLVSVVVAMFFSIFNGYGPSLINASDWGVDFIWSASFNRWASEAFCKFFFV